MKVLVITDNSYLLNRFKKLVEGHYQNINFDFMRSPDSDDKSLMKVNNLPVIDLKKDWQMVVKEFHLVISLHCKQLFPSPMTKAVKCINVHPGFNPYNRGWYPQVFSIINGLPWGATIHEIDEDLDHGKIIVQEQIDLYPWDTSLSAYNRVLEKEIELLEKALPEIISGSYSTTTVNGEGNINLKRDFKKLCKLDLDEKLTMKEAIDRLRALSHGAYNNAFFYDKYGNKIYVCLEMKKAEG